MAKVQILTVESESNHFDTGDLNWHNNESISSASIDAADYIVFTAAWVGGDATSVVRYAFDVAQGSTQLANSWSKFEMPAGYGSSNYGQGHHCLWKETFSGSSNLNHRQQLVTDNTRTVHTIRTNMVMIKVDDTDTATDALHSGDYEMSQTETDVEPVAETWVDCESVTIGDGSDGYLIIAVARQGTGSFGGECQFRLNVGGTPEESIKRKRENTECIYSDCLVTYLAAPAASTVVKTQYYSNTEVGNHVVSNAILAIRLNAFDDYAGIKDTTPVPITTDDTDYTGATLTHTTDHTSGTTEDWFFIGWSQLDNKDNSKRYEDWLDQAGTTIAGAHNNNTWRFTWDNDTPFSKGGHCLFATRNMSDTTDVDVTMGVQEEGDVSPAADIERTNIIGFTHEKTSVGPTVVPTGLSTSAESAFAVDKDKVKDVGLSTESDSAFNVFAGGLGGEVGLPVEVDSAFAVTRAGFTDVGLSTEADSSLAVTPRHEISASRVQGTDTAFPIAIGRAFLGAINTETDSALTVSSDKAPNLPIVVESDEAQKVFSGNEVFVGLSESIEQAFIVVPFAAGTVGLNIEIDVASSVQAKKDYAVLGQTSESDSAFSVTVSQVTVPQDLGWEADDVPWGGVDLSSKDFAPVYVNGTEFYLLGGDNSLALPIFLERRVAVQSGGQAMLGLAVWPQIIGPTGHDIEILLGGSETPEGPIDWEGPYNFTIGEDNFVDFAVAGNYLHIRFQSAGVPVWTLQNYGIEYEVIGRH
jgi:hypothetical protein